MSIKDSKKLSPLSRKQLSELLKKDGRVFWETHHITAKEIDERRLGGENLNEIERDGVFKLLKSFEKKIFPEKINQMIIDCFDVNEKRMENYFQILFPEIKVTQFIFFLLLFFILLFGKD